MMLWLAIAALAVMTLAVLAWALLRQPPAGQDAVLDLSMFEEQLAAAHGREDLLLEVSGQIERAAPWSTRAVWPARSTTSVASPI